MAALTATTAAPIPRERTPDATLGVLRDGYLFISKRCRRHGSDAFQTRLMLHRVTCASGEEAARMFYHPDRFTRVGAMPLTTLVLLQDRGSVGTLSGEAHRHRKQMFLSQLTPEAVRRLADLVSARWRQRFGLWRAASRVVLHDAVEGVLCRAACDWAGVPLERSEAAARTREFSAMIDGSGSIGPRAWRGLLRRRTEKWARKLIERIRAGALDVPEGAAARAVALHRDPIGALLDPDVAALRPVRRGVRVRGGDVFGPLPPVAP
jgi:fatty-acid peroxygenase